MWQPEDVLRTKHELEGLTPEQIRAEREKKKNKVIERKRRRSTCQSSEDMEGGRGQDDLHIEEEYIEVEYLEVPSPLLHCLRWFVCSGIDCSVRSEERRVGKECPV